MGQPLDLSGFARAVRIDPAAWYTDPDLRLLLGMPDGTFTAARRTGQLRHTRIGKTVWHRGQWVIDWLSGTPAGPATQSGEGMAHAAVA